MYEIDYTIIYETTFLELEIHKSLTELIEFFPNEFGKFAKSCSNTYFLAHLGYIPMSLYNRVSRFHHYMGS